MAIVTPPGAERLPGWGVTKLSDEAFAPMREDYESLWDRVSAVDCWALLAARMRARTRRPATEPGVIVGLAHDRAVGRTIAGAPFPHDRHHPLDAGIDAELARIASLVLAPGHTALLACGDSHGLALALARQVSPGGALHVLEPRRLRAQRLCADVVGAGLGTLHLHAVLGGPRPAALDVLDFDPASESDQAEMGNVATLARVPGTTLDALMLDTLAMPACAVLILRPPQDPVGALDGAREMLRKLRPLVLVGSVPGARLRGVAARLVPLGYTCAAAWAAPGRDGLALCVATPDEKAFELSGFRRIEPAREDADVAARAEPARATS